MNAQQGDLSSELLNSEQLYRLELTACPDTRSLSPSEQDALIARARSGDADARNTLITALLRCVAAYARRYYSACAWASTHMSYLELVEVGNVALVEYAERALAPECNNPWAYLTAAAYSAIRKYTKRYCSMIVTPYTDGVAPIPVASLDAPLTDEGDGTLYDLVADEMHVDESEY